MKHTHAHRHRHTQPWVTENQAALGICLCSYVAKLFWLNTHLLNYATTCFNYIIACIQSNSIISPYSIIKAHNDCKQIILRQGFFRMQKLYFKKIMQPPNDRKWLPILKQKCPFAVSENACAKPQKGSKRGEPSRDSK